MSKNVVNKILFGSGSSGLGTNPTIKSLTSTDHPLVAAKTFYFFFFAAMASFAPFLTLYFEQIGLTGRQIGLLVGISPLVTLFSAPLFGGLADLTRQNKCNV